jgi:hypothetical protein
MNQRLTDLVATIRELENEIEAEIASRREGFRYTLENHQIRFVPDILAQHKATKTGLLRYLARARLRHLLSAPLIYVMIVPLVFVDLAISLYQWVCFPLYGIPRVRRADYFIFDRHHLAYLNAIEKLNCAYCSYANGLTSYLKITIALTEQYWCPIKHARRILEAHSRYERFLDFGDAVAYRDGLKALREDFSGH